MKKTYKSVIGATMSTLLMATLPSSAVVLSFNDAPASEGLAFGSNDLFAFGGYGAGTGTDGTGNSFGVLTMTGLNNAGHGNSVPIDPSTITGLAVGDVLRYSMWFKNDAANPVTGLPQTAPLLKFEFHDNALDGSGSMKQFDTEQGAGLFTSVDPATASDWSLYSFEYEINGAQVTDLAAVQEIRPVLFAGEFAGGTAGAGTYFIDNVQVEWFDDAAAAAANPVASTNPMPVPEPSSSLLAALGALGLLGFRRRK